MNRPEIRRAYEWWRTVDFSRDLNLARRRLVEVIRAKLDMEEHSVVKKTEKHQWAESRIKQVKKVNSTKNAGGIRLSLAQMQRPKFKLHYSLRYWLLKVLELNGVYHVREGDEIHVVYPRSTSHASCEDICILCNVCSHRYSKRRPYSSKGR